MDPNELLSQGAQVVKAGALAVGAAIPFTGMVKSILGPAAGEISERIRDEVRLYRFSRQVILLKKAEKMVQEAGFTPKSVPIKILFPLLEGASLEEAEDLHDMWASLLANASNDSTSDLVRPSFCELLKLMTPDVAKLLNREFDHAVRKLHPTPDGNIDDLCVAPDETGPVAATDVIGEIQAITQMDLGTWRHLHRRFISMPETETSKGKALDVATSQEDSDHAARHRFSVAMDELHRMQMWNPTPKRNSGDHYYLSALAAQFVTVCRRPSKVGDSPAR